MGVEIIVDVSVERLGNGEGFLVCWVGFYYVFQQLPSRTLSAFCHPVVWNEHIAVRTPYALDEHWFL